MLKSVLSLLFVGLAFYSVLLAYLYFNQANLIYLPIRGIAATPHFIGLEYESITLETDDGVKLNGWFLPHDDARATLLFFHGNAGNISHRLKSLELFHQLGLSVLIIDYRGYGQSEGTPSEEGIYQDAEAAWNYLTVERKLSGRDILLFGRSFGGAVAAYLAAKYPHRGLVLESTFTSAPDVAAAHYPWFPVRWLSRFQYNTRERLSSIPGPVMVIHSPDDEIIPFSHGQTLFALAREPKRFVEINGDHNSGVMRNLKQYRLAWDRFIRFISDAR